MRQKINKPKLPNLRGSIQALCPLRLRGIFNWPTFFGFPGFISVRGGSKIHYSFQTGRSNRGAWLWMVGIGCFEKLIQTPSCVSVKSKAAGWWVSTTNYVLEN